MKGWVAQQKQTKDLVDVSLTDAGDTSKEDFSKFCKLDDCHLFCEKSTGNFCFQANRSGVRDEPCACARGC